MNWDVVFTVLNFLVLPAWALLIFLPRAKITNRVVHSALYPVAFGLFYAVALVMGILFGQAAEGTGFSTISGVSAIFDHPNGVLIGWSHYLVFDLFVGAWIGRDAAKLSIPHLITVPCLLGAFLFGPTGLLLYAVLRLLLRNKWTLA